MSREVHVPFYEGLGVQFPRPTHRFAQLPRRGGLWPAGVSKSPMRPSGSGVGGSVLRMRADCGADVVGLETPGISTRCSSLSRVASNTCGAPSMRPVASSTSSCNRDGIGTPRCHVQDPASRFLKSPTLLKKRAKD